MKNLYTHPYLFFIVMLFVFGCSEKSKEISNDTLEGISGHQEFKSTSYITAGDRVYAIGAQNGSFPEIGWHITGEMGGVWNHPIKLLDGYKATVKTDQKQQDLTDASFVNYPFGNKFIHELNDLGLTVEQFQFSPDGHQGLIIEYAITNHRASAFSGQFEFQCDFDLRPTWLGERTDMIDGQDQVSYDTLNNILTAKDSLNQWYASVSSSETLLEHKILPNEYKGNGVREISTINFTIDKGATKNISYYIPGSYKNQQESLIEIDALQTNHDGLKTAKRLKFEALDHQSKLTTSDPEFDQVYRWIKYNSDWFVREVPEIGRGIAAGYPDYPWWFGCDSEYALKGYLSIGAFDLVKDNISLLARLSRATNDNGRIIHETSTNGAVFNPGNLNETPQFASLIWEAYKWTADESLLRENFDLIKKGLQWVATQMDSDGNGFPEGAGMMEIHGLESEMIDVASYTQRAFFDAAHIAKVLGETEISEQYLNIAQDLKNKINQDFWVEDFDSFADFIASDEQTLDLISDAIVRADTLNKPWAVEELKSTQKYVLDHPSASDRPFVLHHNWVVNTPMEMGIADEQKAQRALNTARKFVNPYGVFVTGIDRDESAGKEIGSFKGSKVFSYTGAVMTLPTGVSAVAENNYGNPDQALDYLKRMGKSFSFALPGSIYEVSPDYGMFAQAWNIYSYAVPVVQQFFGISPDPEHQSITLSPLMPSSWDHASLENVRVGDNLISIYYKNQETGYKLEVKSAHPDWNIKLITREGALIKPTHGENSEHLIYEVK